MYESMLCLQEFEINELNIKVNDIKGKFAKPVLKKVSKTESKYVYLLTISTNTTIYTHYCTLLAAG